MYTIDEDSLNYYAVLGVDETASEDEIKKAYRKLVKQLHPDAGGNAQQFDMATKAYEILRDPYQRQCYDDLWKRYVERQEPQHFTDSRDDERRAQAQAEEAAQKLKDYLKEQSDLHKERSRLRGPFGDEPAPKNYWRPGPWFLANMHQTCGSCHTDIPLIKRPRPAMHWRRKHTVWIVAATIFLTQAIVIAATGALAFETGWNWIGVAITSMVEAYFATALWWRRLWWRQTSVAELVLAGPAFLIGLEYVMQGKLEIVIAILATYLLVVRLARKRTERPISPCGVCMTRDIFIKGSQQRKRRAEKRAKFAADQEAYRQRRGM